MFREQNQICNEEIRHNAKASPIATKTMFEYVTRSHEKPANWFFFLDEKSWRQCRVSLKWNRPPSIGLAPRLPFGFPSAIPRFVSCCFVFVWFFLLISRFVGAVATTPSARCGWRRRSTSVRRAGWRLIDNGARRSRRRKRRWWWWRRRRNVWEMVECLFVCMSLLGG